MKGIIFAAGIGSRLKPFTDFHPKALAPVAGTPAIDRVIRHLVEAGVTEIVVNVHHFAQQIIEHLEHSQFSGVKIEVSDESSELLDTAGALVKIVRENSTIQSMPGDESVIVHNADIITDAPLLEMLRHHKAENADATLLVDPRRESSRSFLFDNGLLAGWRNNKTGMLRPEGLDTKGLTAASFGGVHILRRSLLDNLSEKNGTGLYPWSIVDYYINTCLCKRYAAFTPSAPYSWFDIGTPEKLQSASEAFSSPGVGV